MIRGTVGLLATILLIASAPSVVTQRAPVDFESLPFAPKRYEAPRATAPLVVDGRLDEPAWQAAPWTTRFVDIDGVRDVPLRTRAKMLWDDSYFYIAAELEEPDVWATLTERDAIIFHDNDFEVFIDPDGDTHNYYELEVNALGTPWDLLLVRPYRDGGPALHAWDIAGLQVGVDVQGTLNRPGDRDQGWTVELALPWEVLKEAAPGRRAPQPGEQWRVNFSRVQWRLDVKDGAYVKRPDPATGKPFPEDNWVWSPQGAINMHMPERWGYVEFVERLPSTVQPSTAQPSTVRPSTAQPSTVGPPTVEPSTAQPSTAQPSTVEPSTAQPPSSARSAVQLSADGVAPVGNDAVAWALRRLYYRQQAHRRSHGRYASDLATLGVSDIRVDGLDFRPTLQVTHSLYEISAPGVDGATVRMRSDGRVWIEAGGRN